MIYTKPCRSFRQTFFCSVLFSAKEKGPPYPPPWYNELRRKTAIALMNRSLTINSSLYAKKPQRKSSLPRSKRKNTVGEKERKKTKKKTKTVVRSFTRKCIQMEFFSRRKKKYIRRCQIRLQPRDKTKKAYMGKRAYSLFGKKNSDASSYLYFALPPPPLRSNKPLFSD